MAHGDHKRDLPKNLRFMVVVTSDTILDARSRGEMAEDQSGDLAESMILKSGHSMAGRLCIRNEGKEIRDAVLEATSGGSVDVVVVSGGTGLGSRDRTVEAVSPLMEKTLPGFGELFRHLSFGEVGTSAMASRALAGVRGRSLVFLLPGSPNAVRLAMERLILPESPHLLKMLRG